MHRMSAKSKAFTLLELMLSIAVMGVLASLLIVSMRAVRASASRTDSLGALRQMGVAHTSYSTDHRQQFMPGYIDPALFAVGNVFENLKVTVANGFELADADKSSYVWRMAPYLDNAWETYYHDTRSAAVRDRCQTDFYGHRFGPDAAGAEIDGGISERPTYGLNSILIGGDKGHGPPDIQSRNPWDGSLPKIAAVRVSEVKNPTTVVLFAPTAKARVPGPGDIDAYDDSTLGFCELRPPCLTMVDDKLTELCSSGQGQWQVGIKGRVEVGDAANMTNGMGLPIDRTGGATVPVVHIDGSCDTENIPDLSVDMVKWNPFETVKLLRRWTGNPNERP